MVTVKLTRAISVDLNWTFNLAYIICRFELHKYMKSMREFKRNAALCYVMRKILIYQCLQWRHDPSPHRSWIL